jgi:tetratricopeptide (TPR) repeat protein/3',5'-cyclic AMP phosphodiesterase CpdA
MPVTWLHVSDFHIREGEPYDRHVVLRALVASVRRMREKDGRVPDLVFATGDIAFSGKPAEYAMATKFFDDLLDATGLDRRRLFVIPGNHDVDRKRGLGLARTLETPELADAYFDPEVPKVHLTQKLGAYVKWHNKYFRGIRKAPTQTTTGPAEPVEVNGTRIGILPLNSALFCLGDDDHAKLLIGRRALEPGLDELRALKADLNVALIHHPLEWLSDIERSNIRTALQENVDVVLRGHLHESDVESTITAHGGFLHMAAGASYQTRKWPNRALYGTFDGAAVKVFPIRYEDKPKEVWVVDPSVFPDDAEASHAHAFEIPRLTSVPVVRAPAQQPSPPQQQASTLQFRSNIQPRHNLPFVGRAGLLDEMRTVFADTSREAALVLHGQPGVGKSELAREYARVHRQLYPGGTFLIRAGSGGESVDLVHIGKVQLGLEFPANLSIQEQGERTLLSLASTPVLLIYDNAISEEGVRPWLPPAGIPCHVVATTNSERWSPGWRLLLVERLPDAESLSLIKQVGGDQVAARFGEELVQSAGGLPVQLVPAASALGYEARRGRLDAARVDIVQQARDSFRVPYESLGDPERLLLHSAAFLNIQRIIRDELFNALATGAEWSEDEFRARLDACLDLHVLEGGEELRMHQLFAPFIRSALITPEFAESRRRVRIAQRDRLLEVARSLAASPAKADLATVLNGFPLRPGDWIGDGLELSAVDGEAVGIALSVTGKYEEARPWFERAVEEARQGDVHVPMNHTQLVRNLHWVGICLAGVGKDEEARPWFERAVEEKQQGDVHGQTDHASLGISLQEVGNCLSRVGKYDEARQWYERAVEEKEQGDVHGRVNHESLGSNLHEVGYCLSSVWRYEEARPWFERAVEEKQQGNVHGRVDHESLGLSLHQVGLCLSRVGKYGEALPWFERAVEETQQGDVYGRMDHANVGMSLHGVGDCLSREGKDKEARPWYERAVNELEQGDVHGRVDHERLSTSIHWVGICLTRAGKHEAALPWFERAVDESRQGDIFGRTDRASLRTSLEVVAGCLRKLGRADDAQEWENEAAALATEQAAAEAEAG